MKPFTVERAIQWLIKNAVGDCSFRTCPNYGASVCTVTVREWDATTQTIKKERTDPLVAVAVEHQTSILMSVLASTPRYILRDVAKTNPVFFDTLLDKMQVIARERESTQGATA